MICVLYVLTLINSAYGIKSSLTPFHLNKSLEYINKLIHNESRSYDSFKMFESYEKVFTSYINFLSNNSCSQSLKKLKRDVVTLQPYALKIIDSWGKPESGLFYGNMKWEGRYYECIAATDNIEISGQYCQVVITSSNNLSQVHNTFDVNLGLCFPDTCSIENISYLFSIMPFAKLKDISCINSNSTWKLMEVFGIVVFCLIGCLVILSTLYDYILNHNNNFHILENKNNVIFEEKSDYKSGRCCQIFLCFSLIRNNKLLFDTNQKSTDISCLYGIKFLSISWIVFGHIFTMMLKYLDNFGSLCDYIIKHFGFQVVLSGPFCVDTFFCISGILSIYRGIALMKKTNGKINILSMYFLRYIRLTPAYGVLLLIMVSWISKAGDGPFWFTSTKQAIALCQKYWYTNLFYFNNLYPVGGVHDECLPWTWYLANDTQFYLLIPLFLWLLHRYSKVGIGLIALMLFASVTITGVFSELTNQQPTAMKYGLHAQKHADFIAELFSNSTALSDDQSSFSPFISDLYTKPWCRIGAYLIGVWTGYFLSIFKSRDFLNKITAVLGWLFSVITYFILVYSYYSSYSKGEEFSRNVAALYNALSRPLWSLAVAWVVVACVYGYGGPVNKFLSWKIFIPLSRLTYCLYLFHPAVIIWFSATAELQVHFSMHFVVMSFLCSFVLAIFVAYVVAMFVEFPFTNLGKLVQNNVKFPRFLCCRIRKTDVTDN